VEDIAAPVVTTAVIMSIIFLYMSIGMYITLGNRNVHCLSNSKEFVK
jgi:hypothetical protein